MNLNQKLMPLFSSLALNDKTQRISASIQLITLLNEYQTEFIQKQSKGTWENQLNDIKNIKECLHPDVYYSLNRLIKGLASARESARLGYSLALAELLRLLNYLPVSMIVDLILEHTPLGTNSEENRNHMFGRLFGLNSIIRSNLLNQKQIVFEDWKLIINTIFNISSYKSYLLNPAYVVLEELVLVAKKSEHQKKLAETLWEAVNKIEIGNSEHLAFYLLILTNFTDSLSEIGKDFKFIQLENFEDLGEILIKKSTHVPTNLPSSWQLLMDAFFKENLFTNHFKLDLGRFWEICVENTLFKMYRKKNIEFEMLGLKLLKAIIPLLKTNQFPLIFSEKLVTFLYNVSNPSSETFALASEVFNLLNKVLQSNPIVGFLVVIMFSNSSLKRRKNGLVHDLINEFTKTLSLKSINDFINYLIKVFNAEEELQGLSPLESQEWSIHQMSHVLKYAKLKGSEDSYIKVMDFLTLHSFFNISLPDLNSPIEILRIKPNFDVSNDIHQLAQNKLLLLLKDSFKMAPLSEEKTDIRARNAGFKQNQELWIQHVNKFIQQLNLRVQLNPILPLSLESKEQLNKVEQLLITIESEIDSDRTNPHFGFFVLVQFLELFLNIDGNEAAASIKEVIICYEKIYTVKKGKSKKKAAIEADGTEPVDVLVDLLISYLTKSNTLFKEVIELVFERWCSLIKQSTLSLIFDIINNSDEDDLLQGEDDEENDDIIEMDEDEINGDMLNVDLIKNIAFDSAKMDDENEDEEDEGENEEESSEEENSEKEESDDDDEGSEEDDDDGEQAGLLDEELAKKVKEALGKAAITSDNESDLDDEEMSKMDANIEEMFKQAKLAKKQQEETKTSISQLKVKLLEWISIYINKQGDNLNILYVIEQLLVFIKKHSETSITNQADILPFEKGCNILINNVKKIKLNQKFPKEEIKSVLENAITLTNLTNDLVYKTCSNVIQSLLGEIIEWENKDYDKIVLTTYTKILENFFENGMATTRDGLLIDLMSLSPKFGWHSATKIIEKVSIESKANRTKAWMAFDILLKLVTTSQKKKYFDEEKVSSFIEPLYTKVYSIFKASSLSKEPSSLKLDQLKKLLSFLIKLKYYLEFNNHYKEYDLFSADAFISICDKLLSQPNFMNNAPLRDLIYQITGKRFESKTRTTKSNSSSKLKKAKLNN
ncbi:hypothetical protein K502DRAFT_40674 [Neoconidiobolus thromboides FSU 785]|nr:hypothetical protein K502DRAFT_40674 [Neoconidiobolus thromboides FSU 785]